MNLIPSSPGQAPHYWCTWMAQTADFVRPGEIGGADHIDERLLFESPNWLGAFFPRVRGDLLALIDAGWDIPQGYTGDTVQPFYGALRPDPGRFPSLRGSPTAQLAQLNRKVLDLGWRGTGLWVIAQGHGEAYGQPLLDDDAVEADFRAKAQWTRDAGIAYWKIDFGMRGESYLFRRMLTRVLRERSPGTLIEHVRNQSPFNGEPGQAGCDPTAGPARWKDSFFQIYRGPTLVEFCTALLPVCDALRTYDVSWPLSTAITLDRVAAVLEQAAGDPACRAYVNCEDEPYLAAALGCVLGILRYPEAKPPTPRNIDPHGVNQRIDEVVRALHWSRLAPPCRAGELPVTCDRAILVDTWHYRAGDVWVDWAIGKTIRQAAPARVARNLPLPVVACAGDPPFVVGARHPNGATAVATLPRTQPDARRRTVPRADVTVDLASRHAPVGVFGRYQSLALRCPGPLPRLRVLAQDLAGDRAQDITEQLQPPVGHTIVIPGAVIDRVGLSAATPHDESDPGLVLVFEEIP